MKVRFSAKDTGACPLCDKRRNCPLQFSISETLKSKNIPQDGEMEIVIYVCPYFHERD